MRPEHWLYMLPLRLRSLLRRDDVERELDEELRYHVEQKTEKFVALGMAPEEARRAAIREFGGVELSKENCRDARRVNFFQDLLQDLRYGIRTLRKSPVLTAVAVTTIALGIAANVTVFSFVDALFLRSVPAKEPRRLVRILAPENDGEGRFSYPEYAYLRDHAKTLESLAAHYSTAPLYVRANGETGEMQGAVVSSSYFPMLGLRPYMGRFFSSEEDAVPDRDEVAVVGYGLWQRIYSGAPSVLGQTLVINGKSFTIIGVTPPDFHGVEIGGTPNEIWIPTAMVRAGYRYCDGLQPSCTILALMGRLKPGARIPEARAEIGGLLRRLQTVATGYDERLGVSVEPAMGISGNREYFAVLARLLMTIGGALLMIVCANVGGLLIARGASRGAEIAMRTALGAARGRIVRQLLTESLLLAGAGGAFGAVLSLWTGKLLAGFYSVDSEGYRHLLDVRVDARVVLYSFAVTVSTGVLFGLLPALQGSRVDLISALRSGGSSIGLGRRQSRNLLVVLQVALSFALLAGAGLLVRSAARIESGTNMDVRGVLGLRLRPQLLHYSPAKAQVFTREAVRRLRELPGVESVSLAKGQGLVWGAGLRTRMALPGRSYPKPEDEPVISFKQIAQDYFATLKIPFITGRDFNDSDRPGSPPVAIVNETLASRVAPDKLPLDQTILIEDKPYQIVGVVKDAQVRNAVEGPLPVAYLPFWQDEALIEARMCIRVTGDPAAALPMIRKTIASIDSEVPVTETMPLIEQVRGAYTDARVARAVLGCAALLGLLLSAMGLYGVISYEVSKRTKEIGVRMALGASRERVIRLFLWQGVGMILLGSLIGVVLALATTRLLASWLISVQATDPASFFVAAAVLLGVTLVAICIPARRAMRVDPMVALRYE